MREDIGIIVANLDGKKSCTTRMVFQYNRGMRLLIRDADLPPAYRVEFTNSVTEESVARLGNAQGVTIPYELFVPGEVILAWVVDVDTYTRITDLHIRIPISPMAQPGDDEPDPEEASFIGQTMAALNSALAEAEHLAKLARAGRVSSLDDTPLVFGAVEAAGIPVYVSEDDLSGYSSFGLTNSGWYVFGRINAPEDAPVSESTTVTGAAGYIATAGANHVDVAVQFEVAAVSKTITVTWAAGNAETFIFRASDLAIRNLDYRSTFYVYDAAPYATWSYALTTDATFTAGKNYYTESDGVYTLAEVTAGDAVPENTYYNHSKLTFENVPRNVTYRLDAVVDCPSEFILPEIDDNDHGAWFEIQLRHNGSYSMTLVPPEGVKVATEHTQAESAGMNMIDLHYMNVDGVKLWRFMNTHATIPA